MFKFHLHLMLLILSLFLSLGTGCSKDAPHINETELKKNNYLLLVNKDHPLCENFIPSNLVIIEKVDYIKRENELMLINEEALYYYNLLYADATKNNLHLTVFSAYRSYEKQNTLWNNNPNENYVARPGQSEHQTGLAIDISRRDIGLITNFMYTDEYIFLSNNAHKFGFINRYPLDKEIITGYMFEPWHYRFVGIDVATKIFQNKITLEEYLA